MAINMLPHRRFPNCLELMPEPRTAYPEQRRISLADRVPDNYSKVNMYVPALLKS
jgi:hypothetical protein